MNFSVLLDDLGHFSIMRITSDNATLSFVFIRRRAVRFKSIFLEESAQLIYAPSHGFVCDRTIEDADMAAPPA